jgi:hypothetical protein
MLPNLSTLALSPGNVLVLCPGCASLFRKASPTAAGCGCPDCEKLGKRKRDEEEKEKEKDDCSCKKECTCDDDGVPDPNDPNMSEQWRNAYLKARGISYGSLSAGNEGEDNPEPWQIEAARRKLAPQDRGPPQREDADDPDQGTFRSGCTEEDCEPQDRSSGEKEDEEDGEEEDESEGEGDDVGDWRDDANFDYYRAVMP